jgi:hypothetical protein
MSHVENIVAIRSLHRRRRYAMKVQQKIDRAMESFIRINATEWTYDASEDERERFNREVKAILAAAREGKGEDWIVGLVEKTNRGREPFDAIRKDVETSMEKIAAELPVSKWIKGIRGAGLLGLATIYAEAGDLANFSSPAKLWKRLGFAPYDGFAGSTWKRPTWRPRTLSADEWIENPFSGERYALIHQIAVWLVNAQWISAKKAGSDEGKPNGKYGEVYAKRRAHTATTHPAWTKQHSRMDALRVAMKTFLKDLWLEATEAVPQKLPKAKRRMREQARHRPQAEA